MGEDKLGKMRGDVIVCSLSDPAGTNIRERLIENYSFKETDRFFDSSPIYKSEEGTVIVSSNREIVYVDHLDGFFNESRYIFISKHRAESGIPSLTAHFTGNFGKGDFGGRDGELSICSPTLLKNYFLAMGSKRDSFPNYTLTVEATHHGPTSLKKPVVFIELGSTPEQWTDTRTSTVIAEALMESIGSTRRFERCAIGVGGTHYPEKFNKLLSIEDDFAIGHVIPKYALQFLDSLMLEQVISKSETKIRFALVDAKGLGEHKQRIFELLNKAELEIVRA